MTKKMRAAIAELLKTAKRFAPNDKQIRIIDDLADIRGRPRKYGQTYNLDEFYTDHDAVRFRNAIDKVNKLLGKG